LRRFHFQLLQFCQNRSSPNIVRLAEKIGSSRGTEGTVNVASLGIEPIAGALTHSDGFVLWDALGRNPTCESLGQLLARVCPLEEKMSNFIKKLRRKMVDLNGMSRHFARDMAIKLKRESITSRLCALLSGQRLPSHEETPVAEMVFIVINC
jgi:hypothetical protein